MKIGIVVDNELNNDIRVLKEIEILKESGFGISVLCFSFSGKDNKPLEGINITRISISRTLKNIMFFLQNTFAVYEWMWASMIRDFITANSVEALHVHDLYMARAARRGIKSSGKKIPLVLDLHENYPYSVTTYNWTKGFFRHLFSQPEKWKKKEKEYLKYADRIIVLSAGFRDHLLKKYPDLAPEKFTVFPNVPNLQQAEPGCKNPVTTPFENSYPIILYYGVIAERRGIFDAINVFTGLVREGHNVNFLLIGPVDKKDKSRFMEMTHQDVVKSRLHYIPWINSRDFPCYLKISDICIAPFHKNPQHESGVANKIYEYMLGERPLIVSDCGPQKELTEKENCGIVFSNMTELHEAIIKLVNDEPLRKQMGINGKKAVLDKYNTGVFKENLVSAYSYPR